MCPIGHISQLAESEKINLDILSSICFIWGYSLLGKTLRSQRKKFGSIPNSSTIIWACNSAGRVLPLQGKSREFEPHQVHQTTYKVEIKSPISLIICSYWTSCLQ